MTDISPTDRPERLFIAHTTADGIRVVTLRGDIDHDVKDALTTALLPPDGADDGRAPRVVADLSGVTSTVSRGFTPWSASRSRVSRIRFRSSAYVTAVP
ncbi:hypothetical protein ABZ960_43895, partial [Streptomyces pseudovenezuelae]|uniref:hypothetical protein n=1 Tax=Streptomyces pseudovenezuelae TaxID=67350 RepID=UPI0034A3B2B0